MTLKRAAWKSACRSVPTFKWRVNALSQMSKGQLRDQKQDLREPRLLSCSLRPPLPPSVLQDWVLGHQPTSWGLAKQGINCEMAEETLKVSNTGFSWVVASGY